MQITQDSIRGLTLPKVNPEPELPKVAPPSSSLKLPWSSTTQVKKPKVIFGNKKDPYAEPKSVTIVEPPPTNKLVAALMRMSAKKNEAAAKAAEEEEAKQKLTMTGKLALGMKK